MFGRKKKPKREMPYETRKRRYGKVTSKYPKTYTAKEWKRFSPDIQQELTNRYDVTISDYKTRNQKIRGIVTKKNVKNTAQKTVKGARRIDRGLRSFDRTISSIDAAFRDFDVPKRKGKSTLDRLAGY